VDDEVSRRFFEEKKTRELVFRKLDQSDFTLADAVDDSLLFDDP
jgi:hypothetical protein